MKVIVDASIQHLVSNRSTVISIPCSI